MKSFLSFQNKVISNQRFTKFYFIIKTMLIMFIPLPLLQKYFDNKIFPSPLAFLHSLLLQGSLLSSSVPSAFGEQRFISYVKRQFSWSTCKLYSKLFMESKLQFLTLTSKICATLYIDEILDLFHNFLFVPLTLSVSLVSEMITRYLIHFSQEVKWIN